MKHLLYQGGGMTQDSKSFNELLHLSLWRMTESIWGKQVSLLTVHLGKPKCLIEIANIEFR